LFHLVLRPEKLSLNLYAFFPKTGFLRMLSASLDNSHSLL